MHVIGSIAIYRVTKSLSVFSISCMTFIHMFISSLFSQALMGAEKEAGPWEMEGWMRDYPGWQEAQWGGDTR